MADPLPPPSIVDSIVDSPGPSGKPSDYFYPAWDKFLAPEPKRAKATSRAAAKIDEVKATVEKSSSNGLAKRENAATSYEQAAAECKAKVAAIVDECTRLNRKYRDMLFDLEANRWSMADLSGRLPDALRPTDPWPGVKRVEDIFEKPEFFIDGASADDVHQGNDGDCWFLAALMAISAKKGLIEKLCVDRNEKVGVYGFVFYRDGEWIYEVIDDNLYLNVHDDDNIGIVQMNRYISYDDEKLKGQLQKGGEALYFSHCKSNETWLPLIEKAYAKAHGDYYAIEAGFPNEGIEDLTGGVGVLFNSADIMDKDRFWREQLSQVNEKYLFGGGSKPRDSHKIFGNHAYAVLEAWEEGDLRLLKVRNPWGKSEWDGDWSDGSKLWTAEMMTKLNHTFGDDGVFWMAYKDFLKYFPDIDRVRLFDDSWTVAQQWTSVNVPWTVDYLDTKFQIEVTEKGPVVIVLCQPDERYFQGLCGRYKYSMHFRVYKTGDAGRWIVRSMHNSGTSRSVSAEIEDLEPGTYDVVFKVTAIRLGGPTAEENILSYAVNAKEKLLSVGRRFDYAQSKGNLRGLERANVRAKKQDGRDTVIDSWKKDRKLTQKEKERARKRKKRVDDAILKNQREYDKKVKERQERRRARKEAAKAQPADEAPKPENATNETDKPAVDAPVAVNGEQQQESTTEEPQQQQPEAPKTDSSLGEAATATAEAIANLVPSALTEGVSNLTISGGEGAGEAKGSEAPPATEPNNIPNGDADSDDDNASTDSEFEPPVDPPILDLDDDDFDWDSDIDGPHPRTTPYDPNNPTAADDAAADELATPSIIAAASIRSIFDGDYDGEYDSDSSSVDGIEIFKDDPWNAMCVLGLRVYSQAGETKVRVVKASGETEGKKEGGGKEGEKGVGVANGD